MQSKAATVEQYLKELPEDRRAAVEAVRRVILKNLDKGYEERMSYGMIGYAVPHRVYPAGYHCDPTMPLPFAGLASQKNHMSLYLMGLYNNAPGEKTFREAWEATGRKLDMGKCCIRFKKLEDVALDVIGEHFKKMPAKAYVAYFERMRAEGRPGTGVQEARKKGAKKGGKKVAKKAGKKKAGGRTAKVRAR